MNIYTDYMPNFHFVLFHPHVVLKTMLQIKNEQQNLTISTEIRSWITFGILKPMLLCHLVATSL